MTTLIQSTGAAHTRIWGLGAYRPSRVITNDEVCTWIESSDEWIRTRSGIRERRWAVEHETVQLMAVEASRKAIAQAGIDPERIGAVVVATVSHFLQTPAIATSIAAELGIHGAAFDISAACAGFCHGVAMASDFVRAGSAEYVLVIASERISDLTDTSDRTTAFLFADGAGAAVIGPSDVPGIGPVVWGSVGEQADLIKQSESWLDNERALLADPDHPKPAIVQDGNPVFRWASFAMAEYAQEALDRAGVTADQLDLFVPHQANGRIIDALARSIKLPETVTIARDIETQGNTSAASIPLALDRLRENGEAKSGDLALFIAFGAGLVYAAQVVVVP